MYVHPDYRSDNFGHEMVDTLLQTAERNGISRFQQNVFKNEMKNLGCGYDVVGIVASKYVGTQNVVMVGNDQAAIKMSKINAELNDVEGIKISQTAAGLTRHPR